MNTKLKASLSEIKTLLILSALCLLSGILCFAIGEIMVPFVLAFLTSIYIFETGKTRIFGIIASVLVLGLNAVGIIFKLTASLFGPATVILAIILALSFSKKQGKADCSYLMTVIYAVFTVGGFILLAMMEQGEYTLDAALSFYKDILESLPPMVTETMNEVYTELGITITEEDVAMIFDSQVKMIMAYLFVGSFAIVGISMKLFGLIYSICAEDKKPIIEWRFTASSIFAYFYPVLAFLSLFITSMDSVFAVSVLNLYVIFTAIFAYIGFNFVWAMLMTRMSKGASLFMLLVITLVFASFLLQLYAVIGVFFTVKNNKRKDTESHA